MTEEDKASGDTVKILGLQWNTSDDTMSLRNKNRNKGTVQFTRSNVLKTFSQAFDPNGYYNLVLIQFKILFQSLCIKGYNEEQIIDDEQLFKLWISLCADLEILFEHKINRHIGVGGNHEMQLCCFTGESENSYGAVVYVRYFDGTQHRTHLIISKAKVSPKPCFNSKNKKNGLSIPRLERPL